MKEQNEIKTKKDVIEFIKAYVHYRGGMGNRIDAYDILAYLNGYRKVKYKEMKRLWENFLKMKTSHGDKR